MFWGLGKVGWVWKEIHRDMGKIRGEVKIKCDLREALCLNKEK